MAMPALNGAPPTLGVVFASPKHDLGAALAAAKRAVPAAAFVGCNHRG